MKLLILGASGNCGRWLVQKAHQRGHEIKAVVRESTKFDSPKGVKICRGSVLERNILIEAIENCDAVISALGIKRKNPLNPWSNLASPSNLTTRVAEILVELMKKEKIKIIKIIY